MFEFGAKFAEAEAGAVCDLGAAVQVQYFDVSAVLSKCPGKQSNSREGNENYSGVTSLNKQEVICCELLRSQLTEQLQSHLQTLGRFFYS